jgi:hypothetical protein
MATAAPAPDTLAPLIQEAKNAADRAIDAALAERAAARSGPTSTGPRAASAAERNAAAAARTQASNATWLADGSRTAAEIDGLITAIRAVAETDAANAGNATLLASLNTRRATMGGKRKGSRKTKRKAHRKNRKVSRKNRKNRKTNRNRNRNRKN